MSGRIFSHKKTQIVLLWLVLKVKKRDLQESIYKDNKIQTLLPIQILIR